MKFDLTKPCANCPFRRKGGVKLTEGRIREISDLMLDSGGGMFVCHKTDPQRTNSREGRHCAGALIFALKNDNMTQMMRIAGRLGGFNPDALQDQDDIFDDQEEMLEGALLGSKR